MVRILINIIIDVPLIIHYGAIGAAGGAVLSEIVFEVIYFKISQHYYYIKWEYSKLIVIYSMLFCSAAAVIIMRVSDAPFPLRYGVKLSFIFIYILAGVHYGVITKSNIQTVMNLFPPLRASRTA
jgi:hypothetical protein